MTTKTRIPFLIDLYGRRILQMEDAIANEITNPSLIIHALAIGDPSSNGRYTQWVVLQYLKRNFPLEDIGVVRSMLTRFDRVKSRLGERDINRFSYQRLCELIDEVYGVSMFEQTTDFTDVQVLYDGPFGLLAIPHTEEASKRLGAGTQWCTAADFMNAFDKYYSPEYPLYIWRDKSGAKYQFYFHPDGVQFKDARDNVIGPTIIDLMRGHPVLSMMFERESFLTNDVGAE